MSKHLSRLRPKDRFQELLPFASNRVKESENGEIDSGESESSEMTKPSQAARVCSTTTTVVIHILRSAYELGWNTVAIYTEHDAAHKY